MKVAQPCSTLCDPMDCVVHGILQARIEWAGFPFSRGSSQPRDRTQASCIAGRFFTSWATGEPKNTGVGSLSLLRGVFLTQESNRCLLHCRWILYQLSLQSGKHSSVNRVRERQEVWFGQGCIVHWVALWMLSFPEILSLKSEKCYLVWCDLPCCQRGNVRVQASRTYCIARGILLNIPQ